MKSVNIFKTNRKNLKKPPNNLKKSGLENSVKLKTKNNNFLNNKIKWVNKSLFTTSNLKHLSANALK